MFTENLHLEQERTKFIYQDRHKLIVLFPPFSPGWRGPPTRQSGVWRWTQVMTLLSSGGEGPGPFLPGAAVLSQRAAALLGHPLYWGPPDSSIIWGHQLGLFSGTCLSLLLGGEGWMSLGARRAGGRGMCPAGGAAPQPCTEQ